MKNLKVICLPTHVFSFCLYEHLHTHLCLSLSSLFFPNHRYTQIIFSSSSSSSFSSHSCLLSLSSSLFLPFCLLTFLLLLPPPLPSPHTPPTVWTAAVSPLPPVFLSAASAGEGSPSGKTLSSPPPPPPTLPVWLTPGSGTPAHTH